MTIQREFKQLRAAQRICCVLFAPHCLTARVYIIIDGQTNANHRPTRTAQPWHLRLVIVSHVDRCVGLIKVFCTGAIKFNQSTCCMDTQSQRIASARVVFSKALDANAPVEWRRVCKAAVKDAVYHSLCFARPAAGGVHGHRQLRSPLHARLAHECRNSQAHCTAEEPRCLSECVPGSASGVVHVPRLCAC